VFQHGDILEDILFAHVLAVTALGKGGLDAGSLAAASLDRCLHQLGQPQIFRTQFRSRDASGKEGWTMDPYNRQLLPPILLEANCVPGREHPTGMLTAISRGKAVPAPQRMPCAEATRESETPVLPDRGDKGPRRPSGLLRGPGRPRPTAPYRET
jgi:hypothetical protein